MNNGTNSGHFPCDLRVLSCEKIPKVTVIGAIVHDAVSVGGQQMRKAPDILRKTFTTFKASARCGFDERVGGRCARSSSRPSTSPPCPQKSRFWGPASRNRGFLSACSEARPQNLKPHLFQTCGLRCFRRASEHYAENPTTLLLVSSRVA